MEASGNKGPEVSEQDKPLEYKVTCIAPTGLGFGEGSISTKNWLENGDDPLTDEVVGMVDEIITQGDILVPVETDDDGCGDGRPAGRVMKGMEFVGQSFNRAKTFGGGLTMGVAARLGLGDAKTSIKQLFEAESDEFKKAHINYGAHTGRHAPESKSGCGAIDEAPAIVENVSKYSDSIAQTLGALSGLLDEHGVDASEVNSKEVLNNYAFYTQEHSNQSYSGKAVIEDVILEDDKVVKELENEHREVAIVINTVDGMTVDQGLIRSVTNDVAQVFAIDIPKKINIANKRYNAEDTGVKSRAILSMLAYTLATAATLTDGSLPVYVIEPSKGKHKALEPALV